MTNTTTENTNQLEALHARCDAQEQEIAELKKQVNLLLEQLRLARHRQFGKSSERTTDNQIRLHLITRLMKSCE
ncbi:transposase domain-containing protein [Alicyclobacillus tolerans]|uniref:transposase domain-containing protein n=1 Tax=Alicyclobacillus tolerans TaxID=90970 RepID=UPI003B7B44D8